MKQKFLILLLFALPTLCIAQVNPFLKKYAGSYYMLADGQVANSKSDKYVFTPDGKCTWTTFTSTKADGSVSNVPVKKIGTWKASDGLIQISFDMGDEGGDLLTDFKLNSGVFRAEGVFLKKIVAKAGVKK